MSTLPLLDSTPRADGGWDSRLQEVARVLPSVLDGLRASYGELAERAARVEHELAAANRERVELTERLHAADKLSALGTLAAGIAHEIRNPLNAVRGFAELLAAQPGTGERARLWAGHIVAGVLEVDAIVDNLLSFGSPEGLRPGAIAGGELLEEAARLVAPPRGTGREIALLVRADVPAFRGDHIKLRQAVRNLIENALEAQEGQREPRVEVELAREGDELVFRVADAGPGVPPDLRARILDPFFTTHADGTGLGLALVSVIARLHGGSVQCSPRPSALGGALFVLRIPFQPADRPAGLPRNQRH
jgi:signal transduction histidine kinase